MTFRNNIAHSSEYLKNKYSTPPVKKEEVKIVIPIMQTGGIGDLIVTLPWLETFKDSHVPIRLYTNSPDIAKLFLPWVDALSLRDFAPNKYPYWIRNSDLLNFKFTGLNGREVLPDCLQSLYDRWLTLFPEWGKFIENDPYCGNDSAKLAVSKELTRWTIPLYFLDKPYKRFSFETVEIEPHQKFITIHDGFDSNHTFVGKSMKSWDTEYWEYFVFEFKRRHRDIKVVQLGGGKDLPIRGIDIDLVGKIPFSESLKYLNSSLVHVDTESGLVHARRLFNKPSVVIFGPTNINYFGYPDNINLEPKVCGDCWWKKRDWMNKCVQGYDGPLCMQSVKPEEVLTSTHSLLYI